MTVFMIVLLEHDDTIEAADLPALDEDFIPCKIRHSLKSVGDRRSFKGFLK